MKFERDFTEKWRELEFKNLNPCTEYSFSIETIYKLPIDDEDEEDSKRSSPKSIAAETLCPSTLGKSDDDYNELNDENSSEVQIPTTTSPPIQPISDVVTEQTVQVLTNMFGNHHSKSYFCINNQSYFYEILVFFDI